MILTFNGDLFVFGSGTHGQLGMKATQNYETPQLVQDLQEYKIIKIAAGWNHSLALTERGGLFATGHGEYG